MARDAPVCHGSRGSPVCDGLHPPRGATLSPVSDRRAIPPELGARLRARRRARGWGVRELGRRAGASFPHVAAIERGERAPGLRVAEGIIAALRLDPATAAELLVEAEAVEEGRERRAAERRARADAAAMLARVRR